LTAARLCVVINIQHSYIITPQVIIVKAGESIYIKGRLKGRSLFKKTTSPYPFKERGIKGVR